MSQPSPKPVLPTADMRIKLPHAVDSDDESQKALIAEPDTPRKWRMPVWLNNRREKLRMPVWLNNRTEKLRGVCLPRKVAKLGFLLAIVGVILFVIIDLAKYAKNGNSKLTDPWIHQHPKVYLPQGIYTGGSHKVGPHFIDYFHMPYAQTTAGENRFRAPKKLPEDRETSHDATQWREKCWGGSGRSLSEVNGDDCLNINIWRPRGIRKQENPEKQGKVPVAIFFHGGSFNFGSGSERDIQNFVAWSVEPMIGISVNYRMGAMGFLSGNFSKQEAELNVGLKDMRRALDWIQENIRDFGGDPEQVTIWGISAGAHAVGHLLMNKIESPPPFARALMESGGPTARACYPYDHAIHEQQLSEFFDHTGASNVPDKEKMAYLRNLTSERIQAASEAVFFRYDKEVRWPWQPVIDGDWIPKAPIESWKAAEYHKVPILTGFNTDEGTIFVDHFADEPKDFDNFFKTLLPGFNQTDLDEISACYPDPSQHPKSPYVDTRTGLGRQFKRLARAYGDYAYISPVRQTAHYASSLDRPDDREVWLYQFDANQSVADGAAHGRANPYIEFSKARTDLGGFQRGLAVQMHAYFSSFILCGNPNDVRKAPAENRTPWPSYGKKGSSAKMVFGKNNDQIAGGTTEGGLTHVEADLRFDHEGDFWWSMVMKSES